MYGVYMAFMLLLSIVLIQANINCHRDRHMDQVRLSLDFRFFDHWQSRYRALHLRPRSSLISRLTYDISLSQMAMIEREHLTAAPQVDCLSISI